MNNPSKHSSRAVHGFAPRLAALCLFFAFALYPAFAADGASSAATDASGAVAAQALPPAGAPPGPSPSGGGGSPGGAQAVDHGSYANIAAADASGKTYVSSKASENALRVQAKAKVSLSGITIKKTGDASGNGDASSFYGLNAGLLVADGATASVSKSTVTTSAKGANGIFAYGSGTSVTVSGTTIRTSSDGSGGIMVAGGGSLKAADCDIETQGGSSAAIRSDRGGGALSVTGGTYVTRGSGSPAIYSTAAVSVSGAELKATGSEAIVIEGKNSVTLKDCAVSGKMVKDNVENLQAVMIYQSMSGDADVGKSSFSMTGGSLTSLSGDLVYVTNTSCSLRLEGVALKLSSDYLLKVVGNDARNGWGKVGSNGGKCDLTAVAQVLEGKIKVDSISGLSLSLTKGSSFSGSINSGGQAGTVSVALDAASSWKLTADSYVSSLSGSTDRIDANGHALYVAGKLFK
jgi:hypothetical protein